METVFVVHPKVKFDFDTKLLIDYIKTVTSQPVEKIHYVGNRENEVWVVYIVENISTIKMEIFIPILNLIGFVYSKIKY